MAVIVEEGEDRPHVAGGALSGREPGVQRVPGMGLVWVPMALGEAVAAVMWTVVEATARGLVKLKGSSEMGAGPRRRGRSTLAIKFCGSK